jgi:hypothetical protein
MNDVKLKYANTFCSFACMSHLYNTAQQLGLLKGKWCGLERAMKAQISTLFSGELPAPGRQMLNRFLVCLKFPATAFARNSRLEVQNFGVILAKSESIFEPSELSKAIGKYLDGMDSAEKLLYNVFQQRIKCNSKLANYDPLQMLKELRDATQDEIPKFDADLINISRKSNKLLEKIRENLGYRPAGVDFTKPRCPYEHRYVHFSVVFKILSETFAYDDFEAWRSSQREDVGPRPGKAPKGIDIILQTAEIIEQFLDEANYDPVIEPFDVVGVAIAESLDFQKPVSKRYEKLLKRTDFWGKEPLGK